MHTLQVSALLFPESCACLLDSGRQRNLNILRHNLISFGQGTRALLLPNQLFNVLNAPMAVVKALGDVLRKSLNLPLFGPFRILIVEAREHMLLMQALQLLALTRHVGQ